MGFIVTLPLFVFEYKADLVRYASACIMQYKS
jgi:hypothetical protein